MQFNFETGEPPVPPARRDVYSVSRLNREARGALEQRFATLWIEGELSNFSRPASGHWYFTLKDEGAQVRCAMFRNRNQLVRATPRDGQQVLLRARVSLYEGRGEFQLVVDHLEDAGAGLLQRRFEELKQRLAAEGLFDAARKRPLPALPRRIGVITSPTGAALRDILHVLARRFPQVPVLLYPVPVQGDGAAAEIAAMLRLASQRAEVDVLILARGGGSLEDLWAFNEEAVARAIADCRLPVISGVGHETDFTIADFVADVRAPTPSAAAETAVPDRAEWLRDLAARAQRLVRAQRQRLAEVGTSLTWALRRLGQLHPQLRLEQQALRLDELDGRLALALRRRFEAAAHSLDVQSAHLARLSPERWIDAASQRLALADNRAAAALRARLERGRSRFELVTRALHAVSPLATLERGYAIVTAAGRVVTDAATAPAGTEIETRLARGTLRATVHH
jgi:exodeoxyribonuclease VII large subunit